MKPHFFPTIQCFCSSERGRTSASTSIIMSITHRCALGAKSLISSFLTTKSGAAALLRSSINVEGRRFSAVVATVPKEQVPKKDEDRVIVQDSETGDPILVALVNGQFYAVEGNCPHMNKSLEKGKIVFPELSHDPEIRCLFHNTRFNLKSGACTKWVTGAFGFNNSVVGGLAQKVGGEKRDLRSYKVISNSEDGGSLTICK